MDYVAEFVLCAQKILKLRSGLQEETFRCDVRVAFLVLHPATDPQLPALNLCYPHATKERPRDMERSLVLDMEISRVDADAAGVRASESAHRVVNGR